MHKQLLLFGHVKDERHRKVNATFAQLSENDVWSSMKNDVRGLEGRGLRWFADNGAGATVPRPSVDTVHGTRVLDAAHFGSVSFLGVWYLWSAPAKACTVDFNINQLVA